MKSDDQLPFDPLSKSSPSLEAGLLSTDVTGFVYRIDRENPPERSMGLAFRHGGYSIHDRTHLIPVGKKDYNLTDNELKWTRGMKILLPEHSLFKNMNLKMGDVIGSNVPLMADEIDMAPLDLSNSIDVERCPLCNKDMQIIAKSITVPCNCPVTSITGPCQTIQRGATIVEFSHGDGRVIHFGSIAWYRGLLNGAKDKATVPTVVSNAVSYVTKNISPTKEVANP
jgi:hypothetical protein